MTEGRAARNPRPWSPEDVCHLAEWAGTRTVEAMAWTLGKTPEQVDNAAFLLDLDTAMKCPDLEWCVECAAWRTQLNADGRCPVCRLRASINAEAARIADAISSLTPEQRTAFDATESGRGQKTKREPYPPRPSARTPTEADALHAVEVEEWETAYLQREYNALKSRLKRVRRANGTNPRAKKPEEG